MDGNNNRSTFADLRRMRALQIAPWCNGPFRLEVRVRPGCAADRRGALSANIHAAYAIELREGDREKKGDMHAGGRTGVPRPPKVKSRDGGGSNGDRALQDARSKREVKRVAAPLTRSARISRVA